MGTTQIIYKMEDERYIEFLIRERAETIVSLGSLETYTNITDTIISYDKNNKEVAIFHNKRMQKDVSADVRIFITNEEYKGIKNFLNDLTHEEAVNTEEYIDWKGQCTELYSKVPILVYNMLIQTNKSKYKGLELIQIK